MEFQIFTSPYVDFLLENGHKQVPGFKTVGLLFLSSLGKHIDEQAKTSIHDSISINLKTWEAVYFLLNDLSKLRMIFKKIDICSIFCNTLISLVMPHNIPFSFAYSRLYQFIGDVTVTDSLDLQPLFAEYESNPGNHDPSATSITFNLF